MSKGKFRIALVRARSGACKAIRPGKTLKLGRHRDNDIVVLGKSVSRFHAQVTWEQDAESPTVRDLGSSNGTQVDGFDLSKGEDRVLGDESTIKLGEAPPIVLEFKGAAADGRVSTGSSALILRSRDDGDEEALDTSEKPTDKFARTEADDEETWS